MLSHFECVHNFKNLVNQSPSNNYQGKPDRNIHLKIYLATFFLPINIESQCPDSNSDHAFIVVKELDCFCVKRKVVGMLKWKS